MVEIYDNIFDHEQMVFLENYMLSCKTTCTNTSDGGLLREESGKLKNKHLFFGACLFSREDINRVTTYHPEADVLFDVFDSIQNNIKKKYYLKEISINLQHAGCNGSTHTDGPTDRHKTIMLMSNCYWEKEWGGQFQLVDFDDNIIEEYEYVPGRVIIFPGNHPHRGLGAKIEFSYVYRTTLVFRTEPLVF